MKIYAMTNYYSQPTSQKWKKIGDSILYGCGAIGAGGLFGFDQIKEVFGPTELKVIIGTTFVLGFIGKFLSNFFKADINEVQDIGDSKSQIEQNKKQ